MKTFLKINLIGMLFLSFAVISCEKDEDNNDDNANTGETTYTEEEVDMTNSAGGTDKVTTVTVKDFGEGTGTMTWTSDKVWILDGFVYVNDGQTLTIEPGTLIKGKPGQAAEASAITVARGGKMIADGTANKPIIFTSVSDNITPKDITMNGQDGRTIRGSLQNEETGLWGGLNILGNATINYGDDDPDSPGIQNQTNGIPESEKRGLFGGTNDQADAGTYRYISVRHGGTDIGASNEINGVTFAGVGSATTIEYIEAYANADDGIEVFGGTADMKHLVIAHAGDDGFDFDAGWRGSAQYIIVYGVEDTGGEHDGGNGPDKTDEPFLDVKVSNVTCVGATSGDYKSSGTRMMTLRQNTGAKYVNSIFINFEKTGRIDVVPTLSTDAYRRFLNDECFVKNSIFYNVDEVTALDNGLFVAYCDEDLTGIDTELATAQDSINTLISSAEFGNTFTDPQFQSLDLDNASFLVPAATEATSNMFDVSAWNMETVNYKGAIDPTGTAWYNGWSYLGGNN